MEKVFFAMTACFSKTNKGYELQIGDEIVFRNKIHGKGSHRSGISLRKLITHVVVQPVC